MPLLALLVSVLWKVFRSQAGTFIVAAMTWLGIAWGTQKMVVQPAIDALVAYAGGIGSAAGSVGQWAGVLNVDKALTMIISAYVARNTIQAAKMFLKRRAT